MAARDGAGLAAPQTGVALRLVIFGITHNPRYREAPTIAETALINPLITPLGEARSSGWEGCLSVPGLRGGVDPAGLPVVREVEGFHARVVQRECDRLDGVLFPDRVEPRSALGFTEELVGAGVLAQAR